MCLRWSLGHSICLHDCACIGFTTWFEFRGAHLFSVGRLVVVSALPYLLAKYTRIFFLNLLSNARGVKIPIPTMGQSLSLGLK